MRMDWKKVFTSEGVMEGYIRRVFDDEFGEVLIYRRHDEFMGRCVFTKTFFVTPNMPKLEYAIQFSIDYDLRRINIIEKLNKKLEEYKGKKMYVYEKRDGFNLLFYEYKGKIIPKTRLNYKVSPKTLKIIKRNDFPINNIRRMVLDGFIPIFEVWGSDLIKSGLLFGGTDVSLVEKIENKPPFNVDLIAVRKADENYEYPFVPPKEMEKLAQEYGLNTVDKLYETRVSIEAVLRIMDEKEKINREYGRKVTEGAVIHVWNKNLGYKMFKVKPYTVMEEDVLKVKYIKPKNTQVASVMDRVRQEITKIILDFDIDDIVRNIDEYTKILYEYLEEDILLTRKSKKIIKDEFWHTVVDEFLRRRPDLINADGKTLYNIGIDKKLIGLFILKQRKERIG